MKVVHLSVCRHFSRGQLNQLKYEYEAAKLLEDVEWTTLGFHAGVSNEPFIKSIPFPFRSLLLRNLYGWLIALKLSKTHDCLLMRHMVFDPFAVLFSPFISNRVSVHHAKEIEELKIIKAGWRGNFASFLERFCGKVAVRNARMILGVTHEIAEYERALRCSSKPVGIYPNGIEVGSHILLEDSRTADEVHVAFICGTFSSWHGLDKLVDAVQERNIACDDPALSIHLIGKLSKEQLHQISSDMKLKKIFTVHGVMNSDEYIPILAKCDFGIGSLAMDRQDLTEGATLKVREMLALGLPVYSGHHDIALPSTAPWVKIVDYVNVADLIDFGLTAKAIKREVVRSGSVAAIEKSEIMRRTAKLLERDCVR